MSSAKTKEVTITVLFIDIMDSMEIANYCSTRAYNNFLNEFNDAMLRAITLNSQGIKEVKLVGDELIVFYDSKDIDQNIINAVELSNSAKLIWYISPTNKKRIKEGKKVLDLGVGINTGKVINEYRPVMRETIKFVKKRKTFEGLTISLAKRIEGFSRQGRYSKIMVGSRIASELTKLGPYECLFTGLQNLKGLTQSIPVYELKTCYTLDMKVLGTHKNLGWAVRQLEKLKENDPSNIWLIMTLIYINISKKKYLKVMQLCREALVIDDEVASIHNVLGSCLGDIERIQEAFIHFNRAIELDHTLWGAYIGKTSCLFYLGKYDECIETCQRAIQDIPKVHKKDFCDSYYYNMACAYARKNNVSKALSNIRRAVSIGGKDTLEHLRKDKDGDFKNLYDNREFKDICRVQLRSQSRK